MLLIVIKSIILYTSDTPATPILQCSHFLNSEARFTVTINVTIIQYIAFENVLDSVSIIPQLIEYNEDKSVADRDSFALIQTSIKVCLNFLTSYTLLYLAQYHQPCLQYIREFYAAKINCQL